MSGKTGKKETGRKPAAAKRKSAKTDGAFGHERLNRIVPGDANRNEDKAERRKHT